MRALAAVVERPVAVARAERGPANGISGEPRDEMGFAMWMISGISTSMNWLKDSI